jgi:hypothetical protein
MGLPGGLRQQVLSPEPPYLGPAPAGILGTAQSLFVVITVFAEQSFHTM